MNSVSYRSSWYHCTCCLAGRQYTIGFLRFCKQVSGMLTHVNIDQVLVQLFDPAYKHFLNSQYMIVCGHTCILLLPQSKCSISIYLRKNKT